MMRDLLVAGNWKMNGDLAAARDLITGIVAGLPEQPGFDVAVFPPFPHLPQVLAGVDKRIQVGAQNLSRYDFGACTGEVSAAMLHDLGCDMVLVGHSERRQLMQETDHDVAIKFEQALQQGLVPILCVGESLEQRKRGDAFAVVWSQLQAVIDHIGIQNLAKGVIAYEPVWAIGTGETATAEQAQEVHQFIRSQLQSNDDTIARRMRILYGGSCKGSNAQALFSMPDVDGGLIGGAALTATDFLAICQQADVLSQGDINDN